MSDERSIAGSSAVMAAGTLVSRLSGYLRSVMLVVVLGNVLHADIYNLANTVPNMLYILLAGGIFNAVLVPQLVRSMEHDADGGDAYANRVVTLAVLFLGIVTAVLVLAAPLIMPLFLDSHWDDPSLAAQRQSLIDIARYCLPQVFFYGMFVLVGQILNARGRFGPMMWAPIANNVIAVAVLGAYLLLYGPATDVCAPGYTGPANPVDSVIGPFTPGREALLGLGSTLGIVVQFLILVPYLRAAGFRFRPRFDFRGVGLGHTLRLAGWTVGFVVVNQIAYAVVVRLASGGTTAAVASCASGGPVEPGTGYTIYSNAFLIMMVPHSIVTVSLATAMLPALSRRASGDDLAGFARTLSSTLRGAFSLVLPAAALLAVVAPYFAKVVWGLGAGSSTYFLYVPTVRLFCLALVFFTVHYLMLRGFYALELNRTVFWIQCAVAATNIAVAIVAVRATDAEHTSPALVVAYLSAYAVGSALTFGLLRRRLGGLDVPRLVRFGVRAGLAALVAAGATWLFLLGFEHLHPDPPSWPLALAVCLVAGVLDLVLFLALARAMRIDEVTTMLATLTRRLAPGRSRSTDAKR